MQGEKRYSWSPCATETGISSSLMGHLAGVQDFALVTENGSYENFVPWDKSVANGTAATCPLTESASRFDGNFDHNLPYSQPITRGAIS